MRFNIDSKSFAKCVSLARRIKDETIQVVTKGDRVFFTAVSQSGSVQSSAQCDVQEEGGTYIEAAILSRIGGVLGGTLAVNLQDPRLLLESEGNEYKIPCRACAPKVLPKARKPQLKIDAAEFGRAIKTCGPHATQATSRATLQGICLDINDNGLDVVGTDGRKMAHYVVEAKVPKAWEQIILHPSALPFVNDFTGEVTLCPAGGMLLMASPGLRVYAGVIDGRYPKWAAIYENSKPDFHVDIELDQFQTGLARAAVVGTLGTEYGVSDIWFRFKKDSKVLSLYSQQEGAETSIEIPLVNPCPGDTEMRLNATFISHHMRSFESGDVVQFHTSGNDHAAIFKSTDRPSTFFLMPIEDAAPRQSKEATNERKTRAKRTR